VTGVSIIIPVFNSKNSLAPLVERVFELYKNYDLEIILIDDGSHDGGQEILKKLQNIYPELIKLVFHKKNLGEHSAIYSGFRIAQKKWAVTLASDYQNPPEEIINLLQVAEIKNFDVIYGQFIKKEHSFIKNLISKTVNGLATILLKKPRGLHLSNFKCVKRNIYKNIVNKNNPLPLIDIAILKETNKIGMIGVIHQKRLDGESSYDFRRYVSLGLRILYNTTPKPINHMILKFYSQFFPVLIY
jgi:undecaprenyl-phosphate 4-deoxy-4-formamido-L-arabinose transferase